MREIKFRVWDKNTKRMWYPVAYDWRDKCATMKDGFLLYKSDIQQFTGLKDKNGKEIYEGDIINPNKREICFGIYESREKGECITQGNGFYSICHNVNYIKIPFSFSHKQIDEQTEVIGNIYENPELLESEVKDDK